MANAAIWLYRATLNETYLNEAKTFYSERTGTPWAFSWDDAQAGVVVFLYDCITE